MRKYGIFLILLGLILVNWLGSFVFARWDLTEDSRYTISPSTISMLENLTQDVKVNVYLSGELPGGFERLRNATREMLEEFKVYARGRLTYQFKDPSGSQQNKEYEELLKAGLTPTNLSVNEGDKRTERIIFPGAVIETDTGSAAALLLKGDRGATPEEQLNQSVENVEFQLATAIRQVIPHDRKKVGLVVSHTHTPPDRFSDLIASLQGKYDVFFDTGNTGNFQGLDALVVLKPDTVFSDNAIYAFDQFVVNGGSALFFVDGVKLDSVGQEGIYAQPLDIGLGELFFRWGARLNYDLVKDLNAALVPFDVGALGDKPQIRPERWVFFPLLNPLGTHPITRNMDAILARYASSIDTVAGVGTVKKTPLLRSSVYTRLAGTPALLAYNDARKEPDVAEYNQGSKLVSLLLEGKFTSLFQNRILSGDSRTKDFKAQGKAAKVILLGDGDVPMNDIDSKRRTPYPMGYDRITNAVFGNKDFVMNALDFLTDENGLIAGREKRVFLRLLDKVRLSEEKLQWQMLNLLAPVGLVVVTGLLLGLAHRRKFAR